MLNVFSFRWDKADLLIVSFKIRMLHRSAGNGEGLISAKQAKQVRDIIRHFVTHSHHLNLSAVRKIIDIDTLCGQVSTSSFMLDLTKHGSLIRSVLSRNHCQALWLAIFVWASAVIIKVIMAPTWTHQRSYHIWLLAPFPPLLSTLRIDFLQVLPERTHPTVNMSGTGGYILSGTVVLRWWHNYGSHIEPWLKQLTELGGQFIRKL